MSGDVLIQPAHTGLGVQRSSIRDTLWGTGKKATQEEVIELTNQFFVTLRAYFTLIKKSGADNARNKEAFDRINALLDGEQAGRNWTNAYEIEQLLVHLFDDDTVATELRIRILEARSILRPELAAMYEAHFDAIEKRSGGADAAGVPNSRRTLLARLVNDLQWRYIVNEATRRYSKLITRRTATLSVFALSVFIIMVVVIATKGVTFSYGDLHLLWVAGLAGTWGATFSMLATLKTRLGESKFDDLKLMKAGSMLLSRAAIGAGAACILFFFLLSGLLGGSAFPSLVGPSDQGLKLLPATDLALLIVWCFVAGFSEQLIPGLLASTEARAATATDRFRPTTGETQVPAPPSPQPDAPLTTSAGNTPPAKVGGNRPQQAPQEATA